MIIKNKNGYLVSDKNVNIDSPEPPTLKCPNCGCVYWNITDIACVFDSDTNDFLCNECGTELVNYNMDKE